MKLMTVVRSNSTASLLAYGKQIPRLLFRVEMAWPHTVSFSSLSAPLFSKPRLELHLMEMSSCCVFWATCLIRCNVYIVYFVISLIYLFSLFLFVGNFLPLLHFFLYALTDRSQPPSMRRASLLMNSLCLLSFASQSHVAEGVNLVLEGILFSDKNRVRIRAE